MQPAGAPQLNPDATLYIFRPPTPITTVTGPLLQRCVTFTKEHGQYIFDPKFSFFLAGMRMMNRPKSEELPLKWIEQFMGFLLTCASPVIGAWVLKEEGPKTAGGAIATAVVAPVAAAEYTARAAVQAASTLAEPSNAESQRAHFTALFIERMVMIAQKQNLSHAQLQDVKNNPLSLIGKAALEVAFLSRKEPTTTALSVGYQTLHRQNIHHLPEECKLFFDALCQMKTAIQNLHIEKHTVYDSWSALQSLIEQLRVLDPKAAIIRDDEGEEWVDLGVNTRSSLSDDKVKFLAELLGVNFALSYNFATDPVFQKQWKERPL